MFKTFRQDVKKALKSRRLTYAQLGKNAGVAEATIKGFMCGASDSRRVAEKIANCLDCSLQYESGEYSLKERDQN